MIRLLLASFVVFSLVLFPVLSYAQEEEAGTAETIKDKLNVCGDKQAEGEAFVYECDWAQIANLVTGILEVILIVAPIIAGIMFMYGGFLYVRSQGNPTDLARAKKVFINVGIGFIMILIAFALVNWITGVLDIKPDYTIID